MPLATRQDKIMIYTNGRLYVGRMGLSRVIWNEEEIDFETVYPVTAFEVEEPS